MTVPTWRARDVTREIDLVEEVARFRLDDVPVTLPPRQAMFGRLTKLAAHSGGGSRTSSSASASRRRTRGACSPRDRRRGVTPARSRCRASRRSCARRSPTGCSQPPAATSTPATPRSRSSRSRTSTCRPATAPGRALACRRHRAGRLRRSRRGRSRRLYEALGTRRRVRAGGRPAASRAAARGRRTAGSSSSAIPTCRATWGAFELDVDALVERVPDVVVYEDVITFPPVRQDLAFASTRTCRPGSRRGRARGRRPRAPRDARVRRLPRRAGRPGPQVDRLLGRRSSPPSGPSRTRTPPALRSGSWTRSRSASAPSSGP